jgi:hypothetical protein
MMKLVVVPLALTFAAGMALACPADGAGMEAKAEASPSVAAAITAKTPQVKAVADKKAVKPAEDKKVTAELKKPAS